MTNIEFIKFVLDDKKVQYDLNLLDNLIKKYFTQSILDIERNIDFDYMRTYSKVVLNTGEYYILFDPKTNVKYVRSVFLSTPYKELISYQYCVEEAESFPLGVPDKFLVKEGFILGNVFSNDSYILFNRKAVKPLEFIVSFYTFTFDNDYFTADNVVHPLLKINSELLYYKLATFIDRYYGDLNSLQVDLSLYNELLKKEMGKQAFLSGKNQKLEVRGLYRL